jgi:hypothetical protein
MLKLRNAEKRKKPAERRKLGKAKKKGVCRAPVKRRAGENHK